MINLKKLVSVVVFFVIFILSLSAQNNEIRFCSVEKNATTNANKINKALGERIYVVKENDIINVTMSPSSKTNLPMCRLKPYEHIVLDSEGKIDRILECGNAVTSYFWNKKKEESSDIIDDNKGNSSDAIDIKKRKIVTRSKNTTINNGSSNGSGGCTSGIRLQDYNNPVNGGSFGSGPAFDFKNATHDGNTGFITENGSVKYHKGWLWIGIPASIFATYLLVDKISDGKLDWNFRREGGGSDEEWRPGQLKPVKPLKPNH